MSGSDVLAVIRKAEAYCYSAGDMEHGRKVKEARAAVAELIEAANASIPFIATIAVGCHGDKCREPWCYSCFDEDEAESAAERGASAHKAIAAALARVRGEA